MSTALNKSGGKKRLRYQSLSDSLQKANVDIVHRILPDIDLDAKVLGDSSLVIKCHLSNQLEECRHLDLFPSFRRFYHVLRPFVQSLPEVLHFQENIITLLVEQVTTCDSVVLPVYTKLVTALARDLGDEASKLFNTVFPTLLDRVSGKLNGSNKATSKILDSYQTTCVFECLSFLIKYQLTNLVEKPNKVIGFYGTVLACEFAPVRDLGAKMFTTLVRKLKKKPFHSHILRTINALTRTWHNGKLSENEFHFDFGTYPLPIIECADEDDVYSDYFQDTEAACDGLARLLFYSCKGVRGCLHSFGGEKLSALLSQLVQSDHMTTTSRDENHSASTEVEHTIYLTGKIASECIRRVFRHLYVSNTAELWIRLSVALDPVIASWKAIATSTNSTTTSSTTTTTSALSVATYVLVEIFIFGLTFSKGRGVCDPSVRDAISDLLVAKVLELVQAYSSCHQSNSLKNNFSKSYLSDRMISLFNYVWILFPRSNKLVSSVQETNLLSLVFGLNSVAHPATIVSTQLISPMPKDLIKLHVMKPLLSSIAIDIRVNASLVDAVDVLMGLVDFRTNVVTLIQETQALLSGSESILSDLTVKCLEIIERVTSLGNIDNSEQNEMLRALVIIKWVFTILPKQTSESIASRPRSFKNHMFKLISKDFSHETTIKSSWVLITHIASVYCLLTDDYAAVVKTISDLFFSCPKSLSFVWSFVAVLESYYSMQLNSDPHIEAETVMQTFLDVSRIDMTISLAGEHLNTSSQWLRVGILRLLQYCPRVQMTDMSVKNSNKESNKNIVDRADVVAICIDICVLSLQVSAERDLTVKLSNLEVFVRSGRLPTAYLKIISAFCVGILSVKFATIWTPAIGVVQAVAATDEGEDIVWPIVLGAIQTLQTETLSEVHSLDSSDAIGSLTEADDGAMSVSPALARSAYFHCLYSEHSPMLSVKETDNSGSAKVEVDSRTDKETLYSLVWKVLELCPNITLKRSKVVVPMFLRFLNELYYKVFADDADIPFLFHIGVLSDTDVSSHISVNPNVEILESVISDEPKDFRSPNFSISVVRKRLEMFLKVFSVVVSPKQLYLHQLLFNYFSTLLASPDLVLAKLAFQCLMTYKPAFLAPYKENLSHFLDNKLLRDELVLFNPSVVEGKIDALHRVDLIPVLTRLLYGRYLSKASGAKAREISSSRRTAILTFLGNVESNELRFFIHAAVQGLLPSTAILPPIKQLQIEMNAGSERDSVKYRTLPQLSSSWMDTVESVITEMQSKDFSSVSWERQLGFLHLLEQMIRVVGFTATPYVSLVYKIVVNLLEMTTIVSGEGQTSEPLLQDPIDENDIEDEDGDEMHQETTNESKKESKRSELRSRNQASKVRSLSLLRLAELFEQYHGVVDFNVLQDSLLRSVESLVQSLPTSVGSSNHPPALLRLIHSMSKFKESIATICGQESWMIAIIACLACRVDAAVMKMVMDIVSAIFERDQGSSLLPYSQLIINSFSRRLVGKSFEYNVSELKLSELNIQPTGSIKAELTLICRIAEGIFSREDVHLEPESITALATLLLAMTRTYVTNRKVRVEESTVTSILRTYKALLWRMQDVRPHVAFFSRLFGPASHSRSLFNFQSVRAILGEVYYAYSEHESTCGVMTFAAAALRALISTDGKLLETRNFDLCMPVFQQLSSADEGVMSDEESEERVVISWSKILGPAGGHTPRSSTLCTAVIHECFRCLYDVENTVRSSALSSLRHLMDSIASWMESSDMEGETWADLMKAIIIPSIHNGLKRSVDVTKRCFVLLAGHILRSFRLIETSLSEDFKMCIHLEATFLLHEDPEQDFFENITHLQLHRRIRAMSKLRERLDKESDMSDRSDTSVLSISTIMNVLLPVAYHPIESEEFLKKDHLTYLQEAAIFVGSLVKLLPWNQYFIVLKTILKMLDQQKKEKEKIILNSLCGVLDSFHFNMIGNEEPTDLDDPILERVRKLTSLEGSPDDDVIEADDAENLNEDQVDKSDNDIIEEEDNDDENEVDDEDANELATKGKANEGAVVAGKVTYASTSPEHISRVVINSVIPWVKVFLLKDDRDHKGNKSQTVRPQVAVALTKLICQLQPPVVSEEKKLGYFTNLVINVVGTLRSRDASARDAARDSLAKMILTTGMHSLYTVIYELRHLLTEGYQRHICNYSVKSILIAVLIDYQSPVHAQSIPLSSLYELSDNPNIGKLFDNIDFIKPELDRCVPMIMECVMDDLTGESRKDFTASETGVNRAVIRESKGSKANDILEISARYILFRPTYALAHQLHQLEFSSIHGLTSPLLNVLRDSEDPSLIGRVGEALQRVALGISRNPTLLAPELLLYLHSTLQPFTLKIIKDSLRKRQALGRIVKGELMTDTSINTIDELGADEIFGEDFPSYLRDDSDDEDEAALYSKKKVRHDNVTGFKANVWLPSQNQVLLDQKAVVEQREREKAERTKVLDGASAPLLTGYNRYKSERTGSSSGKYAGGSSDPAALAAVKFCLTTLQSCIKSERLSIDDEGVVTMLEPFLPILAHCLHLDDASNVATLALRCICSVLNWGVPFDPNLPRIIGNQMLKLMFKGGALLTTDGELVQACLKGLICLFQSFQHSGSNDEGNAQALAELELQTTSATKVKMTKTSKNKLQSDSNKTAPQHTLGMPLKEQNLRLLVQLLTSSINDVTSSYQNSAFQLVKVLVECKVMLPELYDLMEKLIDLIVLAHRKNVRESASSTVVSFMLYYPLGAKRFQVHLKKLLANCAYEYPEGREAALTALSNLVRLMPLTVLEEHAHMIYLPLALRTVNDSSERCRDAACEAILYLSRKVSPELFSQFYEYACKWMGTLSVVEPGVQSNGLVKTGARTATVLVSAKPDFLKKSGRVKRLVTLIRDDLITYMDSTAKVPLSQMAVPSSEKDEGDIGSTSWSVMYRLLLILDRLMTTLPSSTEEAMIQLMVPVPESPSRMHVLDLTQELMLHDHAWVQQAACSVIKSYLHRRDPSNLTTSPSELLAKPNNLYQLGRRLCVLVNRLELSRAHLDCVMECLGFVIRAMVLNPELTTDMSRDAGIDEDNINDEDNDYKESKIDEKFNRAADDSDSDEDSIESNDEEVIDNQDNEDDDDDDDMNDDNINETDNDDAEPIEQKDGANWVMQRLRGVGTDSRGHRRRHVILVFGSLVRKCSESTDHTGLDIAFIQSHLKQMVEVAYRAQRYLHGPDPECIRDTKEAAEMLLESLERLVSPPLFIRITSEVQQQLDKNKATKKMKEKTEFVNNPKLYAMRKIAKSKKKKESKKRKNERHATMRGMKRHRL